MPLFVRMQLRPNRPNRSRTRGDTNLFLDAVKTKRGTIGRTFHWIIRKNIILTYPDSSIWDSLGEATHQKLKKQCFTKWSFFMFFHYCTLTCQILSCLLFGKKGLEDPPKPPICPYGLLCHPCGKQGRRKKRKNHTL